MVYLISIRRLITSGAVIAGLLVGLACCSTALADYAVQSCGSNPNFFVFGGSSSNPNIHAQAQCPVGSYNGAGLSVYNVGSASAGQRGYVQTTAPAGLEFVGASADQISSTGINDNGGWGGGFYWAGGGVQTNDQTNLNPNVGMTFAAPSSYWGLQMICGWATCNQNGDLAVQSVTLYVRETAAPTFGATGLWQTSGWVRGSWPFTASADSPSGVCSLSTTLNGLNVASSASSIRLAYAFKQCTTPAINQTIDTSRYGNGAEQLVLAASDAASVPASLSNTLYVDNTQPTISLSGPTDAPSTAGTQYVTATASAGPSGVRGISCAVDNAPSQWYSSSTAQVPVTGVGEHSIACSASNNAVDANGTAASSAPASWSMKIGDPTVSGITFGHVVDALRCKRVKEQVKVPAQWVTVRRHHKRVRVKRRAHLKVKKLIRCHPRTQIRRVAVRVRVRRHGKEVSVIRHKRERIVLLPHLEHSTKLRVGHGRTATVSGWLGNYAGVALGGQPVTVLAAPNNGLGQFTPAATVATAADGTWSAVLPAGPSRLIEAAYNGGPTTEASASAQIALSVPAKVELVSASPSKVAWGDTVHLVGKLPGGYLPPGGALVRLRIGEGSVQTTYGVHEHVGGTGRFTTTYTFGQGVASVHRKYWFQLASLPTGNYPYAPSASNRQYVLVGGHPPIPPHRKHHRHHHKRSHHHKPQHRKRHH
jgi:hypothetical protein